MKKLILVLMLFITLSLTACDYDFGEYQGLQGINDRITIETLNIYSDEESFMFKDLVTYFPYDDDTIIVQIDSSMNEDIIEAAKRAVEEYDELEFISLDWELTIYISGIDTISISIYDDEVIDICTANYDEPDDFDVLGCNTPHYGYYDERITKSEIMINTRSTAGFGYDEYVALIIHELGHTFGLDDLYEDNLEDYTIMFYSMNEEDYRPELTTWDIENLRYMYGENTLDGYDVHHVNDEYLIYKLVELSDYGTDDVIELGTYENQEIYFSSGTHHLYYMVAMDGELMTLQEALAAEVFTLEELVEDFWIEELYAYELD